MLQQLSRALDKRTLVLLLGMLYVFLCYSLFYYPMYFYPPAVVSLAAMFVIGVALIFLPSYYGRSRIWEGKWKVGEKLAIALSSTPAIFLLVFDAMEHGYGYWLVNILLIFPFVYLPVMVAALIPVVFIHLNREKVVKPKSRGTYAFIILLILLLSFVSFFLLGTSLSNAGWTGTDETAFDYYAAHLFLTGANPYASDMHPALASFNLFETPLLNGTCECRYVYPPLSFLPFTLLSLLSIDNLYPFVFVAVLSTVIASFFIFRKSRGSYAALLLIFEFLLFAYLNRPSAATKYIAVSVLLLLAYAMRRRPYVQGVLLGLAAATHQLAWIAMPFFFLLSIRESGARAFCKSVLASGGAFLAVSGYFLALSPQATVGSVLYLFTTRLQLQGPSFIGMITSFHQVPYDYAGALMVSSYLFSLALFYLYTRTLKPLLAVAPWAIFFMSWFNESGYFISFMPLLIYVYFADGGKDEDRLKDKRYIPLAALLLVLLSALLFLNPGLLG